MARLRLRDRVTVQRASPNPAGDGAGNFQDGWDDYLGPVSCRIEPRPFGGENMRDGQSASAQVFWLHFRYSPTSRLIDARDRVQEAGDAGRLFDVVANTFEPGQPMVKLIAHLTPVTSPQPTGYEPGSETESPPTFPVGP